MFADQVTPYMHVMIHHAAEFAEKYGNLNAFEMEDIEYLNYENKLLFFGASTKLSRKSYISEQVFFIFVLIQIITLRHDLLCDIFCRLCDPQTDSWLLQDLD